MRELKVYVVPGVDQQSPGDDAVFLESLRGNQRTLSKPLFGGCHLTRRISESIDHADFVIDQLDTYYAKGDPKPFGYTFEGRAIKN